MNIEAVIYSLGAVTLLWMLAEGITRISERIVRWWHVYQGRRAWQRLCREVEDRAAREQRTWRRSWGEDY